MKRKYLTVFIFIVLVGLISSCSVSNQTLKTPNYHIEFYKGDFEYSDQVTAEATSVRILGIDWSRLFNIKTGQIEQDGSASYPIPFSVPVLGDYGKGIVSSFALYNLMQDNPGYDVVIYPQYEADNFIVPIFYSKKTVKVTARLGKIKE